MDDQQQGKQRKTSFLRKLFNKITNKPIEPEEDNDDENEEAFEVIDNNVNLEHGEQVNQGENQEEDEDDVPNVNVGNELAQELRAAFELYSKVRMLERCTCTAPQGFEKLQSMSSCDVCCLRSVLTSQTCKKSQRNS